MNVVHNVSRVVHDRVSPNPLKTIGCNCEGAINALDACKDNSQIVVAGRNVFKIYNIEEEKFEEKFNLRVGKNLNLNYSSTDVAWNHNEDHILASAATNGAVVIWDLNRHSKSKQEFVFHDRQYHTRTVNRVRFHDNESQWLLSGSQDGSMRIFDLRRRNSVMEFKSVNSIRDVQWCPPKVMEFHFAAADENGNVHIWDIRRADRCERQLTAAHNGPVFTIDWHPEDKNLFASAGRDKTIKIWDLHSSQMIHQIHTLASVARIRWRPQRKSFIASCSFVFDFSVSVWDINRPYVPFASFEKHTDVVTGIIWRRDDPHVLYSCSRDAHLYQHAFRDAQRPADKLVPSGLDLSIHGDVSLAVLSKPDTSGKSGRSLFNQKKDPTKNEEFLANKNSLMFVFHFINKFGKDNRLTTKEATDRDNQETMKNALQILSMDGFVDCAKNYKLCGSSIQDICEHNARISEQYNIQVAQSWRTLKVLFPSSHVSAPGRGSVVTKKGRDIPAEATSERDSVSKEKGGRYPEGNDLSDEDESEKEDLSNIARGQIIPPEEWDFLFGDGDQETSTYNMNGFMQEWPLQPEAFQPRHEIKDHGNPLDTIQNGPDSPTISANESENNISNTSHHPNSYVQEEILTLFTKTLELPEVNLSPFVAKMLSHYAEQGDVQTAVCMLIILGNKHRPQIETDTQENWFMSYLDLLARFQLWTKCNEIIQLSHLPQVSMLNQQSTRIHINCQKCNRPLQRVGWLCDRCKIVINNCIVCHLPVNGLFIWCQGCSHGGHLTHIKEWFREYKQCPTGCGHLCEFT